MKIWIFSFIALFLSFSLKAQTWQYNANQGKQFLLVGYQEENGHYLDLFVIPKGQLQTRLEHHFFATEESRDLYFKKHFSNFKLSTQKNKEELVLVETEEKNVSLWPVKNNWDLEWEKKYSSWVKDNLTKDFFKKHNLKTDCADVAMALRWIFSRIHFLPAANSLTGSQIIFSHESVKKSWMNLATDTDWTKDQRFLAALNYLLDNTFTGSLRKDTYPISLNLEALNEGTIYLTSHHTRVLNKINRDSETDAPMWFLSSTTPRAVRELFLEAFLFKRNVKAKDGGFIKMRWPVKEQEVWKLKEKKEMPYYSQEQFSDEYNPRDGNFALEVYKKLGLNYSPDKMLESCVEEIKEFIISRKQIVEAGYAFCQKNDCHEPSAGYEEWSTPQRDHRLLTKFQRLYELSDLFTELDSKYAQFPDQKLKPLKIEIEGQNITYLYFYKLLSADFPSYDPNDEVSKRWVNSFFVAKEMVSDKVEKSILKRKMDFPADTWKIDSHLKTLYDTALYLCDYYKNECPFKDFLSINPWLKKIPLLLSSSKEEDSRRWGGQLDSDNVRYLPYAQTVRQINLNQYVLDDHKVFDYQKMKTSVFEQVQINSKEQSYAAIKDKTLYYQDPLSLREYEIEYQAKELLWLNARTLLVSSCLLNQRIENSEPGQRLQEEWLPCSFSIFDLTDTGLSRLSFIKDAFFVGMIQGPQELSRDYNDERVALVFKENKESLSKICFAPFGKMAQIFNAPELSNWSAASDGEELIYAGSEALGSGYYLYALDDKQLVKLEGQFRPHSLNGGFWGRKFSIGARDLQAENVKNILVSKVGHKLIVEKEVPVFFSIFKSQDEFYSSKFSATGYTLLRLKDYFNYTIPDAYYPKYTYRSFMLMGKMGEGQTWEDTFLLDLKTNTSIHPPEKMEMMTCGNYQAVSGVTHCVDSTTPFITLIDSHRNIGIQEFKGHLEKNATWLNPVAGSLAPLSRNIFAGDDNSILFGSLFRINKNTYIHYVN